MKNHEETNKQKKTRISRRQFMGSAAAVAAFTIVPKYVLGANGQSSANEKLNIAGIGVGGRGANDLEAVASEVKLPLVIGGSPADMQDLDYLSSLNVRLCLQGHQPIAAGYRAVQETMKALRDGTKPADLEGLPSGDLTSAVKRNADYERWIDEYLGGE